MNFLIDGIWLTLAIAGLSLSASIALALIIALPGLSSRRSFKIVNRTYVEVFRSVPVLVMILWVYYGLPVAVGLTLGPFAAGVLALTLCDSAFEAEIFRGAIQSIDRARLKQPMPWA